VVELRNDNVLDDVCTASLYPGESVPIDYAECGGMAWVRLVSANPSASFPSQDTSLNNCASTLAYAVEMGVLRKAPIAESILDSQIELPSEEENSQTAREQADDVERMYRAIQNAARDIDLVVAGSYAPAGPDGGVVGGTWSLTVGADL
jgi:hypothetical protein